MNVPVSQKSPNKGHEIYEESLHIIESLLKGNCRFSANYSEAEKAVVRRVIHATSDINYAETVFFTNNSAEKSISLINEKISKREPLKIVCDSEMTKAGISRNTNGNIILDIDCRIGFGYKPADAETTVSAFSIRAAISESLPDIIIVGNAPTALEESMKLCRRLYESINYKPILIIGMPVGFVGAAESKMRLYNDEFFNAIGNFGNFGGSAPAASAMNALLRESL